MSCRSLLVAGAAVTALQSLPAAAADDTFYIDASAGSGISRNPLQQPGNDTAAESAFVQVDPRYEMTDEVSKLAVSATLRFNQYTRLYDSDVLALGKVDVERRLSPAKEMTCDA